jgi:capsule polysaccharide export protein KpsC/LpsZ
VAIKEHPALIGAIDPVRTADLLRRYDNLVLLSPAINNHKVLSAAEIVVTVNSKAGAEALLYRKNVFALGDSFYSRSPLVTRVHAPADLPVLLAQPRRELDEDGVERFFQDVWDSSYPGELYDLASDNLTSFANSLIGSLERRPIPELL